MPNNVAKFLESPCECDSSGSRRACWQSKTFPGIPHIFSCISWHSNFAARLSCDFRKVVDIVVWIVSERRVIELLGLITSCWRRNWPDIQTASPRAECAWPALQGRENYAGSRGRQSQWGPQSGVVSKWPSRNSKEDISKDGWNMRSEKVSQGRHDMRTADTLEPCMCVTRIRMCEVYAQCMYTRKCTCNRWVCVHSPSHTQ